MVIRDSKLFLEEEQAHCCIRVQVVMGYFDGLLSVITATGVHIKSVNVQDVSIRRSFSNGTGN